MKHAVNMLAFLALALGGCSGLQSPTGKVLGVRIDQQTSEGVRLVVTVDLNNPNDMPLPLVETNYSMTVEGLGAFSDGEASERTLPAHGDEVLEMPVALATKGATATGRAYTFHGSVTYQPPGQMRKLLSDIDIPLPSSGFDATGKVP